MTTNDDGPQAYELSVHAEVVVAERAISLAWLEQTLSEPDDMRPDARDHELVHYLRVVPEHGGRVLRVVVNQSTSPRRVVTVFFDRRERKST
jgi:hypothetical protein